MCKNNPKNNGRRIDPCMRDAIRCLNDNGIKTLACCCGHGFYPMTIVIDAGKGIERVVPLEIFSGIFLNRKKRFYVKRKSGHYVIPESLGGELILLGDQCTPAGVHGATCTKRSNKQDNSKNKKK